MPQALPPIRADLGPTGLLIDADALTRALAVLPQRAPVVALVHGFSFAPGLPGVCPHSHILSLDPDLRDGKAISWPRHLALDGGRGLAIALGWNARGTLWQAHGRALAAGAALAELAALVRRIDPGRRLDVVGHSLGARVALAALPRAAAGDLRRLILLAGAEARGTALRALDSPAGRAAQVVNVTTRENDVFDALYEWLIHAGLRTSIGQGLGAKAPGNWRDLWIDHAAGRAELARLGHPLPAPPGRISHWSPYLRPGLFALYRALIDGSLPATALPRHRPARRWSLLVAPRLTAPLPRA